MEEWADRHAEVWAEVQEDQWEEDTDPRRQCTEWAEVTDRRHRLWEDTDTTVDPAAAVEGV